MEERPRRLTRRLATALVVLALAGGWAANARADVAYAFASQTISNITISPALTALTSNLNTNTQDGASVNGSGPSNSNPLNAPQAYLGGNPQAPQDFYGRYAPGNPPVSPTVPQDFTRGDAQIQFTATTNLSSSVAESYINGNGPKTETGSGGLSASFTFTAPATALTFNYNVFNDIFVFTTGSGSATASYKFSITVKDAAGNVVTTTTNTAPASANVSLTAPPQGAEIIRNGVAEVSTVSGLTTGAQYSLIFSGTTETSVSVNAAVPEPNVVMLVGASGAVTLAVGAFRRRRQRIATK